VRPAAQREPVAFGRRGARGEAAVVDADHVIAHVANRERQHRVAVLGRERRSQRAAVGPGHLEHEFEPAVQRPRLAGEHEPLSGRAVKPVVVDAAPREFPFHDRVGLDGHRLLWRVVAGLLLHHRAVADEERP
jgi:hypothetical protein